MTTHQLRSGKMHPQFPVIMTVGVAIVLFMIVLALLASVLAIQNPNEISLSQRFEVPSWKHPFGLDQDGSDVYSKVLYGARVSLLVAVSVVGICLSIGLVIGSLAGYVGGWLDQLFMRITDMFYAFPGFLLALALVAVLGPSLRNLIMAMCITGWTGYARLVRSEVIRIKMKDFVLGAQVIGCHPARIITRHVWPNLVGPLIVQATFGMAGTIITESGLSFLGLGVPSSVPTWGSLLNMGRKFLIEAPHMSIFPGLAILLLVLGFNLFGDGLRDYFDPHQQEAMRRVN